MSVYRYCPLPAADIHVDLHFADYLARRRHVGKVVSQNCADGGSVALNGGATPIAFHFHQPLRDLSLIHCESSFVALCWLPSIAESPADPEPATI
jgi:hypothetical protein